MKNLYELQNKLFKQEIEIILDKAKNNPNEHIKVIIGKVSKRLVSDGMQNGFDLSDYVHNIDVSGLRHAFKHHGKNNEKINTQIPINNDDVKQIPQMLYNYDSVTFGTKDSKGTDIIKYQKQVSSYELVYLEEIRTGKKTLTIKSMYKKKPLASAIYQS